MMPTQTFLTALALASMALPMAASAYEAPEDTLFQENFDEGFLLPPTQRDIKERVMEQQRRSAERREREYSAARSSSSAAPVEEESVDEPTGEDIPSDLQQTIDALNDKLDAFEEEEQSLEARRKERILERIELSQVSQQLHGSAPGTDETLHSGAPLADTGPATWIVVCAVALATVWTIRRAARKGYIVLER